MDEDVYHLLLQIGLTPKSDCNKIDQAEPWVWPGPWADLGPGTGLIRPGPGLGSEPAWALGWVPLGPFDYGVPFILTAIHETNGTLPYDDK